MNKTTINKMAAETFSQMAANGDISDNFSPALKSRFLKLGVGTVMAGLMAVSSGVVHADDHVRARNAGLTLSGLFGVMSNNTVSEDIPVDCHVKGTSGLKVGAGGAVGTLLGNQVGGGNGKTLATIAGGIIGIATMKASENERMRKECAEKISQRNGHLGIPSYATNNASPQSPILYEGQTVKGQTFYVTPQDSPGIAGLQGKIVGSLNVSEDLIVKNALDKSSKNLKKSHHELHSAAQNYQKVLHGGSTVGKMARYAVDKQDRTASSGLLKQHRSKIEEAYQQVEKELLEFSESRAVFANIADVAAVDGYNITAYRETLNYLTPPESTSVVYDGKMPNIYAPIVDSPRP